MSANSMANEGFGVQTREGESERFGASAFHHGPYALIGLYALIAGLTDSVTPMNTNI